MSRRTAGHDTDPIFERVRIRRKQILCPQDTPNRISEPRNLRRTFNGPRLAPPVAAASGAGHDDPDPSMPAGHYPGCQAGGPPPAENLCHLAGCSADPWLLGSALPAGAWDDLRLAGLKLIFLIITRAVSLLGLSRREAWWKDAEILMLRHQLAVAERERPRAHSRLSWPDWAWLALLAGTVPAGRLAAMRLIVAPGTVLRWHRDIVRRRWARLSRRGSWRWTSSSPAHGHRRQRYRCLARRCNGS
jgi:hypothetical protein